MGAVRSEAFALRTVGTSGAGGMREALLDRDADTLLAPPDGWEEGELALEIELREPTALGELRLQFVQQSPGFLHGWVGGIRVEAKERGEWRTCGAEKEPIFPMDWSVGRVYADNGNGVSLPLEGLEAAEALRVTIWPQRKVEAEWPEWRWGLAEILLFGGDDEEPATTGPEEAVDALGADAEWWKGTDHLLAPRWAANRFWKRWGIPPDRLTGLNPRIFPAGGGDSVPTWIGVDYAERALDGTRLGILSERRYAAGTRKLLERLGMDAEESERGPFVLFRTGGHAAKPGMALQWSGHYPLAARGGHAGDAGESGEGK